MSSVSSDPTSINRTVAVKRAAFYCHKYVNVISTDNITDCAEASFVVVTLTKT